MYEKPQYITPEGFRRSKKNPSHLLQSNFKNQFDRQIRRTAKNQIFISKETAQLIAKTIKGMLHSH